MREAVSTRGIFLVLWILASLTLSATAQPAMPSAPPAAPTPAGPADAFERGTPRRAILGFLQACRDGDYERAAAYLDLSRLNSRDRAGAGPTLARRLKVVLDHTLWLDVEALSDDPNGHRDDRLPPNRERLGTISAKRGSVDVLLERVPRDDGVLIWKIAALTVAQIPVARRTAKVVVIAMTGLVLLQNFGFNVSGVIAGLGIGGLAVALAAQETVKNFFGGIALIADQPVRVGDFCRFGDKMGTVEDISIWSTRVRTLERTVVSIPNGQFAGMQLENFARRDQIWLHTTVGLKYGTTPEQVRGVLTALRTMLASHPQVHHETARARFVGFGGPSLHLEISAYILTAKLDEFLAIREDIFLQIMDIIEHSGGTIAAP